MLDGFGFGGSRRHALEKRPVLLIFSDPGCTQCAELMPQVAEWQDRHRQALVITVISRGDPSAKQAQAADFGVHSVLLQKDSEIADKFAIAGTPSAVLVGADCAYTRAAARRQPDRPLDRFGSLQEVREAAEREYILKKLEETNGNVTRTAELLGLERSNLYRKMKTLGIGPKE